MHYIYSIPFIIFALLFVSSLLVVTQMRGHVAGSSPPLPSTVRALHFYGEKTYSSSFLPSRLASNYSCAYPRYAPLAVEPFILLFLFVVGANKCQV